jgi:hypothetical protein
MKATVKKTARRSSKKVSAQVATSSHDETKALPYQSIPRMWSSRTPEERAGMIERWARSHREGAGLSDWAVSRDSMYD